MIPEEIKPEEYFLLNFAFEGLAVHFANNQPTIAKPAKYPGPVYCMENTDMMLYETEFDALFEALENPKRLIDTYNEAVGNLGNNKYLLR